MEIFYFQRRRKANKGLLHVVSLHCRTSTVHFMPEHSKIIGGRIFLCSKSFSLTFYQIFKHMKNENTMQNNEIKIVNQQRNPKISPQKPDAAKDGGKACLSADKSVGIRGPSKRKADRRECGTHTLRSLVLTCLCAESISADSRGKGQGGRWRHSRAEAARDETETHRRSARQRCRIRRCCRWRRS